VDSPLLSCNTRGRCLTSCCLAMSWWNPLHINPFISSYRNYCIRWEIHSHESRTETEDFEPSKLRCPEVLHNTWEHLHLVDRRKCLSLKSAAYKIKYDFGSSCLCESSFNCEHQEIRKHNSAYWCPFWRLFTSRNVVMLSQLWKVGWWNAVPKITLTSF
jgi:hypothetical protein